MSVLEELPLIRAKGDVVKCTTGPTVGPGSYDLGRAQPVNSSQAPFNSTGIRQPLSRADPALPGPGTYDVGTAWSDEHGGIGSRAFVSESDRFAYGKGNDVPGPGAYDVRENYNISKRPKSYAFSGPYGSVDGPSIGTSLGPGAYNPNYAAADRKLPKAAAFGKYSGRELLRPPVGPGPGSYNSLLTPGALMGTKPSSMFVTKTKRTVCGGVGDNDTPGPGTYNVGQSYLRDAPGAYEHFSAFGSSSARFADGKEADRAPGPGTYIGEIAPRRFHPQDGQGSAAFLSMYDRFPERLANSAPGPGTYDGRLLPRHNNFGEPTPFSSTVPRFSPVWSQHPLSKLMVFSGDPNGGRPPRGGVRRPFVQRKITPSDAPPPLQDRVYNVRYDWPKPTSTLDTTFGTSVRPPPDASGASDVPGPGAYASVGGVAAAGRRPGNSDWGRDVRFAGTAPANGTPDPGKYYHCSTLLTKSHNATIGSDTTWID
ncbi:hypothetical protein ABB37_00627 [Leptomonas pyrrhocoris]|uniref:Sperm-tail PG-rich repeat n=1 Tax=Leptomonas pyrrhocoris TaxID=157538 RepID=A0A0M9GB54_LEPPY|nr:hypothetical protein ABB37_00627 [Leptomonas pyrrhocoris]KPA86476.1 hypothetical protein ABB37_00627 [Leptomonas pyrrhocoris]|eukprot:XP_015664915.1 hypothetical protein ABB37_00627 [Leptomonas pyrrhocoris]